MSAHNIQLEQELVAAIEKNNAVLLAALEAHEARMVAAMRRHETELVAAIDAHFAALKTSRIWPEHFAHTLPPTRFPFPPRDCEFGLNLPRQPPPFPSIFPQPGAPQYPFANRSRDQFGMMSATNLRSDE